MAPLGFRISAPFGQEGWLTVESYTRSDRTPLEHLFARVPDPDAARPGNHVLRVSSPAHTDGTVVRPTRSLPPEYRICVRVGFASFGDGVSGRGRLNGYAGGERAEPWLDMDATLENGFYWLAILDDLPRPRNNVWIHHHRKVVIDSDNNVQAWTEVWNGRRFVRSGAHPVTVFALNREGPDDARVGKPFIPYAAGQWQRSGTVRAVDSYKDHTWYSACVARVEGRYGVSVAGDFRFGGTTTYASWIPASRVYHSEIGPGGWPEYFMLGDPHTNFYRGEVYYDDIRLEVPAGASPSEEP